MVSEDGITESISRGRYRLIGRCSWQRQVALLLSLLLAISLFGCSKPKRAPVVSRGSVATAPKVTSSGSYIVRRGDTLYSIAWRYGLDHRSVARWNGISPPFTIYPGQRLSLKPVGTKSAKRVASSRQRKTTSQQSTKTRSRSTADKPTSGNVDNNSLPVLKLAWKWPTKGKIAQRFSSGDIRRKGVKIAGSSGRTITAAEAGKVVYAGSGLIGYGRLIIIKHNKHYLSAYGYNQKILVKEGDSVTKGAVIAKMGSDPEGRPMLHFEIRRNGTPVDPLKLLPRRS